MTDKYKLMQYFAIATFHFYSVDIVSSKETTVTQFEKDNKDVIKRVFDEGLNTFNYELSTLQMEKAIYCYLEGLHRPQSIKNTMPYEILK